MGLRAAPHASKIAFLLNDDGPGVRRAAAWALSQLREAGRAYAGAVADRLTDESAETRKAASCSLCQMGEEGAAAAVARIEDNDVQMRCAALQVLGQLGLQSSHIAANYAGFLAAGLRDKAPAPRHAALVALGQMGEAAAAYAELVTQSIQDADSAIRIAAMVALSQMSPEGEDYAAAISQQLQDPIVEVQDAALEALQKMSQAGVSHAASVLALLESREAIGADRESVELAAAVLHSMALRCPFSLCSHLSRLQRIAICEQTVKVIRRWQLKAAAFMIAHSTLALPFDLGPIAFDIACGIKLT